MPKGSNTMAAYRLPFKLDKQANNKLSYHIVRAIKHGRVPLIKPPFVNYQCLYQIPLRSAWDNQTQLELEEAKLFEHKHELINLTWEWNPNYPYLAAVFKEWYAANLKRFVHELTYVGLHIQARNTQIPWHNLSVAPPSVYGLAVKNVSCNMSIRIPITMRADKYNPKHIKIDKEIMRFSQGSTAMLMSDEYQCYAKPLPFWQGEIIVNGLFDIAALKAVGAQVL